MQRSLKSPSREIRALLEPGRGGEMGRDGDRVIFFSAQAQQPFEKSRFGREIPRNSKQIQGSDFPRIEANPPESKKNKTEQLR
jgi:hypothetical protein